jgi:hypothetical protein
MAALNYIPVSIYGANQNDWNTPQGTSMGFPIQQIVVREVTPNVAYSGVTCKSQIQLLPTGPSPIQPVYYSAKTVAELVSLINTGS